MSDQALPPLPEGFCYAWDAHQGRYAAAMTSQCTWDGQRFLLTSQLPPAPAAPAPMQAPMQAPAAPAPMQAPAAPAPMQADHVATMPVNLAPTPERRGPGRPAGSGKKKLQETAAPPVTSDQPLLSKILEQCGALLEELGVDSFSVRSADGAIKLTVSAE